MVKMTIGVTTTALVGKHFEITGSVTKTYYYAGATRMAVRDNNTLFFLLTDHLGSTAVTTDNAGANQAELRYRAFGMTRLKSGTQKTPYRYTGQRIEGGTDLYYYGARWYDPVVGRFLQADTIVPNPGNPQSLNRYSYVLNNPLHYTDPTGHLPQESAEITPAMTLPDLITLMAWTDVPGYTDQNKYNTAIWSAAARHHVSPQYLKAVAGAESGFRADADLGGGVGFVKCRPK